MIKNKILEKIIVLTLLVCIPLASAQAIVVSGTVVAGLILTGKILGTVGPMVSGGLALAKNDARMEMVEEITELLENQLAILDRGLGDINSQAYAAETDADVRDLYDLESALRSEKVRLNDLLYAVKNEKVLAGKQLLTDAKDVGVGYVKGELASGVVGGLLKDGFDVSRYKDVASGVTTNSEGFVQTSWSLFETAEVAGSEIGDLATGVVGSAMTAQELKKEYQTSQKEMSSEEMAFYKSLNEGNVSRVKAAITDASWENFVNVIAKQHFKDYLRGQTDQFRRLPLAVQEKYIGRLLFMAPSEIDDVHNIMSAARRTGDYTSALQKIIAKYPAYKDTFKALTKDLTGDSDKLTQNIENGLNKRVENQGNTIKNAANEKPPTTTKSSPSPTPAAKTSTPKTPSSKGRDLSGLWKPLGSKMQIRISGNGKEYHGYLVSIDYLEEDSPIQIGTEIISLTRTSANTFKGTFTLNNESWTGLERFKVVGVLGGEALVFYEADKQGSIEGVVDEWYPDE